MKVKSSTVLSLLVLGATCIIGLCYFALMFWGIYSPPVVFFQKTPLEIIVGLGSMTVLSILLLFAGIHISNKIIDWICNTVAKFDFEIEIFPEAFK